MHRINFQTFAIAGRPKPDLRDSPSADTANVTLDYFRLIGLPILTGRDFTAADVARNAAGAGDGVAIVNQSFVTKFFGGQTPLGQRLLLTNDRPFAIVGVVADFRAMGALSDAHPQYFLAGIDGPEALLLLRTRLPPEALFDQIRAAVWSVDRELPAARVSTMKRFMDEMFADSRSIVLLISVFAGLALLLAMLGVYSVLANLVATRTREIGIRMALGATPSRIGRLIAGQSMKPIAIGLGVGVAGGLALGRVIESLLVGVTSHDPLTFVLAVAAVAVVTPLALWVPVRRATRVECTVALREE
jgi:ABC-type antimicrobial peptide transport system permease subunit